MLERQEQLLIRERSMQALLEMDFKMKQVQALYDSHPDIRNVEDALRKFEKTDIGYYHNYIDDHGACVICSAPENFHFKYNLHRLDQGVTLGEIKRELGILPPRDSDFNPRRSEISLISP
jgi:hypothetical protein